MRWLVLRCSGSCLLGLNALQFIFHLFGHCRVNCRVPFCLLNIFLHFFILLDPIRCDALPGHFFFILLNSIHCLVFFSSSVRYLPSHFPSPQFCLVIFNLLNSILCLVISQLNTLPSSFFILSSILCLVIFHLLNSILCLVTCVPSPQFDTLSSLFFTPHCDVHNQGNSIHCLLERDRVNDEMR